MGGFRLPLAAVVALVAVTSLTGASGRPEYEESSASRNAQRAAGTYVSSITHNPFYSAPAYLTVETGSQVTFEVDRIHRDVVSQSIVTPLLEAYHDSLQRLASAGGCGYQGCYEARQEYLWDYYSGLIEARVKKYTNWYVNGVYRETDQSRYYQPGTGYVGDYDPTFTAWLSEETVVQAQVLDAEFQGIGLYIWHITIGPPTHVAASDVPAHTELLAATPNPFNPNATLRYRLSEQAHVKITVHNVVGQPVRTLVNRHVPAGTHEVEWDGTDELGRSVAGGVYLVRMQTGEVAQTRRVTLIR